MRKVVCEGCAYLLIAKGLPPICLAHAYFIDSELCRKVDLKGIRLAREVNRSNNCKRKRIFSIEALRFHKWIKKDLDRKGILYLGRDLSEYKYVPPVVRSKHVRRISEERVQEEAAGTSSGSEQQDSTIAGSPSNGPSPEQKECESSPTPSGCVWGAGDSNYEVSGAE